MKTQNDIVDRVKYLLEVGVDMFGHRRATLINFASYETMQEIFKIAQIGWEGDESFEWETKYEIEENVIIDLMRYKVEKVWEYIFTGYATSVFKTIIELETLLWLFDDELYGVFADSSNYGDYGIPMLRRLCVKYNFPMVMEMGNGSRLD